jgi:N-acetylglucosamine-6-sulfatase
MKLARRLASMAAASTLAACGAPPDTAAPAAATGSATSGDGTARSSSGTASKPNVVFIVTDDLDAAKIANMPKLQAHLVALGMTFENSFATTPICCPSRASMLTGLYAHNHNVWSNGRSISCFEEFRDAGFEAQSVALVMQQAGYRTGLVGKYLNRYPGLLPTADETYVPPGWDNWVSVFAEDRTSDAYYDYSINENQQVTTYGKREADYLTDVLNTKATDFIRSTPADKPFFLWYAPNAPHNPAQPAPRHDQANASRFAPKGGSFNEEDLSDKPRWYQENHPLLTSAQIRDIDALFRARLDTMMAVDDGIEQIVTTLASLGQLENTYIVFTSDNGFLLGQHRFPHGKAAPYEESIRVPLVVRGPGIPAGSRLSHDVVNIDLAPTFAEIAGASVPATADGRSLKPLLSAAPTPVASWRQDVLVEHETSDSEGLPSFKGVRTSQYIFVDYPSHAEQEYYDLVNDPHQLNSRHNGLDAARRAQLKARLDQLGSCRGASCRN